MCRAGTNREPVRAVDGPFLEMASEQKELQPGVAPIQWIWWPPDPFPQCLGIVWCERRRGQGGEQRLRDRQVERIGDQLGMRPGKGADAGIVSHTAIGYFNTRGLIELGERAAKVGGGLRLPKRRAGESGDQDEEGGDP